jgi:cation-transporting ATPase 13A2
MVDSSELVPGDLVDISEPSLEAFPADMILLSGDAIVNESMLTGESVPVSKTPVDDAAVKSWGSLGAEVPPILARHFLFGGTRIIRVRRTGGNSGSDGEAVAMVVRTGRLFNVLSRMARADIRVGFNTTKGALIRSMLFPKPMGS